MSAHRNKPSADEQLESRMDELLRDFFRTEIPVELPPPVDTRPLKSSAGWSLAAVRRLGLASVIVASAVLCANLFSPYLIRSIERSPMPDAGPGLVKSIPLRVQPDIVAEPMPQQFAVYSQTQQIGNEELNVSIADGAKLIDVTVLPTSQGVFEQRTTLIWTSVRLVEPNTGEWIEAIVPKTKIQFVRLTNPVGE